jgi:hypothetical protein
MEYKDFEFYDTNCVGVTGVVENGRLVSFELTDESWEELGKKYDNIFFGDNRLNIFQNGKITISEISYSNYNESWQEDVIKELDTDIIKDVDDMLKNDPIYVLDSIIVSYKGLIEKMEEK